MESGATLATIFQPVRSPSTFEETVERLGRAVKVGLLPAGSRLPAERTLAGQLGISRSTLREALTALAQSGFLVARRGRGGGTFVVASPPLTTETSAPEADAMRAVLDLRLAIEAGVVILAAERATASDLEALHGHIDRMAASERFEDYRRADIRFHLGLAEAADSPRLVTAMTEVQGDMSELITLIAHPVEVLTKSNAQHAELVRLLSDRDSAAAVALVRRHVAGTEHILAGLMPPQLDPHAALA